MKNKLSFYILIFSIIFGSILPLTKFNLLDQFIKYDWFEIVFNESIFICIIFPFALITYFAPERVFIFWWKFARIGIPTAFICSLIVNLDLLHSKDDVWPALTDLPALFIIYTIFTIGSAWQIQKSWKNV